jgi:PAS domain S-box-containing protein
MLTNKTPKKYFIGLFFFLCIGLHSQSKLNFEHLAEKQGLPSSSVTAIVQDKDGFLWLGTYYGLHRYDGSHFKTYLSSRQSDDSISDNFIKSLMVDRVGNLWIGTWGGGLNRYIREKDAFVSFRHNPKDKHSISDNLINAIQEDSQGNIWIATWGGGLNVIEAKDLKSNGIPENIHFVHYAFDSLNRNSLADNNVNAIYQDSKGILWFATKNGVSKWDAAKKLFTNIYHERNNPNSLSDNNCTSVCEDKNGNIWIGTWDAGLNKLNQSNNKVVLYRYSKNSKNGISSDKVYRLYKDFSGNLWIGTWGGGLNQLVSTEDETKNGKIKSGRVDEDMFLHYQNDFFDPTSISGNTIYSIFEDKTGVLWIGTANYGLNKFDERKMQFNHINILPNKQNSMNDRIVRAFCIDSEGNLLVGTNFGGLNYYDKKKNAWGHFMYQPENPFSISNNSIKGILRDKKGRIWIGTESGLNRFDFANKRFYRFYYNPDKASETHIQVICEDKYGYLWIGNFDGGLVRYDPAANVFRQYLHNPNDSSSLGSNIISSIIEDRHGVLWIATIGGGLNQYDREHDCFIRYCYNPQNSQSITSNEINTIFEDKKGALWIGTSRGLNKMLNGNKNLNFKPFYIENDGSVDGYICSILEDNKENLWISTSKGLSRFDKVSNKVKTFNVSNGLQGSEFLPNSAYKDNNTGMMYFGGTNGYNRFHPDSIKEDLVVPSVAIVDFKIFNKSINVDELVRGKVILKRNILQTDKIVLSYMDNVISFEFAALQYNSPEFNQFAYILEGYERDWNNVYNKTKATYVKLPPGEYVFKVKAGNNDGVWNESGKAVKIIILPPWWATWWFRILMVLFLSLMAGYILFRVYANITLKANQTILNERNQLKTLINNMPDLIFIKDTKSRFIVINKAKVKFMGAKDEKEFFNKTDFDFYPKEMAEVFFKEELEIMASGVPIINRESKREVNGQEMILSTTKCPIVSSEGKVIGLIGILRDITEQKQAQQEIIRQSEELQAYNIALNETNVLLEERQQQIEEQAEEIKITNEQLVEQQARVLEQSEELKAQRDQLSMLNATKDKLFSILAHDLRGPFNALIGYSELLIRNFKNYPPEKVETQLNFILDSSKQTFYMLTNLLEWSRSQREVISFNPEPVVFSICISNELRVLNQLAQRKGLKIEEKLIGKERIVNADANLIGTVIRNLISNAIKYSFKDKTIYLTTTYTDSKMIFSVRDEGEGITPDVKENLFKMSNIASKSGTLGEKGTGLGLLICQDFIRKHNGKIWVESKMGAGSEFFISIPLA